MSELTPKLNFRILDGLRGIAAFYVLIHHTRGMVLLGGSFYNDIVPYNEWSWLTKLYYALLQLTILGHEFVIFFFVLSGFSIAHSLTRNPQILPFFKRRLIRLYPPYLLALVWAALAYWFVRRYAGLFLTTANDFSVFSDFQTTLKNLFYIPTGGLIPQFWSLTFEVVFYLLAPFIIRHLLRYHIYYTLTALLYIISLFLPAEIVGHSLLTSFLFRYNVFFAIGILVYRNYATLNAYFRFKAWHLWLVSIVSILSMVIIKYSMGHSTLILGFISAIFSVVLLLGFLQLHVENKMLNWLGKMSYTLYITHYASIYLVMMVFHNMGILLPHEPSGWYLWPICTLVCLLLSYPLFLIGEYPSKRLLDRLRRKRTARSEVSKANT